MGFLDRFRKKQEQEQLQRQQEVRHTPKNIETAKKIAAPAPVKEESKGKKVSAEPAKIVEKKIRVGDVSLILSPLVTEKSSLLLENKQAVFHVSAHATKNEIAKAIHVLYGVTPIAVHVLIRPSKPVRFGRFEGSRKMTKRAIVTFPPDFNIDTLTA